MIRSVVLVNRFKAASNKFTLLKMATTFPNKFQPSSSYCFPKQSLENSKERSFRAEWCQRFDWLHYNRASDVRHVHDVFLLNDNVHKRQIGIERMHCHPWKVNTCIGTLINCIKLCIV